MTGTEEKAIRYRCDAGQLAQMKREAAALVGLMTAAFLLTGTHPCRSMGDIAVWLSWALYLAPLAFSWIGCVWLFRMKEEFDSRQRKKGLERLYQSGGMAALLAGVSVFCGVYYCITGEYESLSAEMGMPMLAALECIAGFALAVRARRGLSRVEESYIEC